MPILATGNELIDPFKLLEQGGIRTGMTVADFGCGTLGHYVFPAAQLVGPNGKVYAVDILKSVLSSIESRKKVENILNIETIWGDLETTNGVALPDNSVDIGLIVNNLFMSTQKDAMVKECTRIIKKDGVMVIADWKLAGVNFGPPAESRVSPQEARHLAAEAGLTLTKEFDAGKYHYGLVFRKK